MGCLQECAVSCHLEDWVRVVVDSDLPAIPCRSGGLDLLNGQPCVVEIPDGVFYGRVTILSPPLLRSPRHDRGRVIRPATEKDTERHAEMTRLADDIEVFLRRRTRELGLDLRPLKVSVPLQGRKAIVFLTAERRVDFRPLLRELGGRFRRRMEMRPFGVRDGARLTGGLGPCGRCLCCATFMERFHSVTVRMAKRQRLSLNPAKISGLCGRLMCCLAHEVDQYPARPRAR